MGRLEVELDIGNLRGGDMHAVKLIVDTGAVHTVLPESFIRQLHIETPHKRKVWFADEKWEEWPLGQAMIRYESEELICPVLASPGNKRLLGATTLEALGLIVDPVRQILIRDDIEARPY